MKLHSLICVGMFAAAGAALGGDVISGTTCAAMAVPATSTYTLIAVPFKDVGGTEAKVKVADVVKTVGLQVGSRLYYYTGKEYYVWTLAKTGAWTGVPVTSGKEGESVTMLTPPADFQVPCGSTLWLQRAEGSDASVVLYGEETAVENPTLTAKTVQLIANPKATDYTFAEAGADGDMIMIPQDNGTQTVYTYRKDKEAWGQYKESGTIPGTEIPLSNFEAATVTIPGGRGAWYVSKGDTVPTITW